ncbi:MAG: hypothetical protein R3F61_30880 [Myxococcota bacterium]
MSAVRRGAAILALGTGFATGCTEPDEVVGECGTGHVQTWVVSSLTFARRDGGVVSGFDVDGHDSGPSGDAEGCGLPDLESPRGVPGVDNNFSALVPILEATEAVAAESLIKQSIASGELLLTLSFDGIDSWMDDDCVDFTLGRAGGVPLVAPDGTLLEDQTLGAHPTIASVSAEGFSEGGRISAGGLAFNLPLDVLNAELDFQVTRGQFQVQKRYDGALTGVMGGVIPIRQITEILERDDVNLQQFVPIVLSAADVRDEAGECSLLSLGFELEAIPAFLEPEPVPPG